MQENLRLFAINTPDTFEKAVKIIQDQGQSALLTLEEREQPDSEMHPLLRYLIVLGAQGRLTDADLVLLIQLLDGESGDQVIVHEMAIDKSEVRLAIPSLLTLVG